MDEPAFVKRRHQILLLILILLLIIFLIVIFILLLLLLLLIFDEIYDTRSGLELPYLSVSCATTVKSNESPLGTTWNRVIRISPGLRPLYLTSSSANRRSDSGE
jgi:hypothetical protein